MDHNPDHLSSDFWTFPLSNDCVSPPGKLAHGIIQVSTQFMSGLSQLLEKLERDFLGEMTGGPGGLTTDESGLQKCTHKKSYQEHNVNAFVNNMLIYWNQ